MKIEQIRVEELRPADYNPRKWSDKAIANLTASIKEFGLVDPIIANSAPARKHIVIGGHFRLKIAKDLGYKEVPVVFVNIPDLEKEKELNLRLNKNTGDFDLDLLAEFDEGLLSKVGFDAPELDKIFSENDEDDFDADAEAQAIVKPITKLGDVWKLGDHRLKCGDATKEEDVIDLFAKTDPAAMVFTDPPYNVDYSGRGKKTSNKIQNDNMSAEAFRAMLLGAFERYASIMRKTGALYCCYASRTHREFEDSLNTAGFEVRNQIIWVKKVASMGWGDYRWKHEPILYCHLKGQSLDFYGDRSQYTEWAEELDDDQLLKMVKKMIKQEEEGGATVWRLSRETNYDHPTQKPIKLVSIAIRNSSKRGEVVADFFGGSGSTLIACENTGRICRTMELDPKYCDVIVKRWEKLTGSKALKNS